jgi:hypothetical protein
MGVKPSELSRVGVTADRWARVGRFFGFAEFGFAEFEFVRFDFVRFDLGPCGEIL